jgi:hypothetical protein
MSKQNISKIAVLTFLFLAGGLIFINSTSAQESCPDNTAVGETSATLVGEITEDGGDPNLTVWFQYGKTTSYGLETSHQAKYGLGKFCDTVYNLSACTTYHFRAVGQNGAGISYGEDKTFTTRCVTPTVDLKANSSDGPITVPYNTAATLSWTSSNAASCTASGAWSGTKATSGSESTGNITSSKTYTLTCTGPGGSAFDSVTVNVSAPPASVDLKANGSNGPITLYYKDYVTLSWTSENAVSCSASGDWSGLKPTSGSESPQLNYVRTYTFTLTCQNASGQTAQDSVQVVVKAKPPTVITKPAVVTL